MPILRETIRIRDKSTGPHQAAASGHQGALSALLAHLHAQQHRAAPHRARAPPPGHAAHLPRTTTEPHAVRSIANMLNSQTCNRTTSVLSGQRGRP